MRKWTIERVLELQKEEDPNALGSWNSLVEHLVFLVNIGTSGLEQD